MTLLKLSALKIVFLFYVKIEKFVINFNVWFKC